MRWTLHAVPTSPSKFACWNRERNEYREIGFQEALGDALQGVSRPSVTVAGKAIDNLAHWQRRAVQDLIFHRAKFDASLAQPSSLSRFQQATKVASF